MPDRHRTLWLSDIHLGSPACKARRLARFLRDNECERLYLVGDIFDGWKMKARVYWTPDHTRVIRAILAKARRGTQVHYLTGNHDAFLRLFVKGSALRLGPIRIRHEHVHRTADGRRLLVQHGDRYDRVVGVLPRLAMAGDAAYGALLRASDLMAGVCARFGLAPGVSPSAIAKHRIKSIVQYLSGFDDAVYHECRRRELHGVICGHTHHAEIRHIRNGVVSYNCGDWVESCTALAEDHEGRIRVLDAQRGRVREAGAIRLPAPGAAQRAARTTAVSTSSRVTA